MACLTLRYTKTEMDSESREYKTFVDCYPKVVNLLKQAPNDVADQLKPFDLLAGEDWEFLRNPINNNDHKARRIADVVLGHIKINSQKLSMFVSALEATGSWTEAVVCELKPLVLALDTNTPALLADGLGKFLNFGVWM